jgi:hypothetical protein
MHRIIYFDNLSLRSAISAETFVKNRVLLTKLVIFNYNLYPGNGIVYIFVREIIKKIGEKK